jgi:hypothetical protein
MEDNFNFDDSEIKKINLPKKEGQTKENIFTKINNSYKDFMRKIKLGFIVDKIDKYFPSLILFVVLFLIILGLVLFLIFYSPMQEYKLDVYVNNKLVNARLSFSEDVEIVNNVFKYYPNKYLNLKIVYNNETFDKRIKTDKSNIRVNLDITSFTNKVVDKTFSFSLESNSGLLSKNGVIKLECDNYSQEFNIVDGVLQNIIVPCDAVKANVSVEGLPIVNQMCGSGLCKIKLNDPVSSPSIEQNLSTNKLLVYVNNSDGTPAKGIEVSIRDDSTTQTLIDKGLTKDNGYFVFELLEGNYIITINDLENKFATQTKTIKITAGASITEYFVLDLPNIGTINLSFDVEDNNFISGFVYLNDENNKVVSQKSFDSNVNLEFGIKALGKYKLSAQLNSSYADKYIAIDNEFEFTETKDLTMNIRKFNSFDDQRLVLQVFDAYTQKPIPNITVFFEESKGSLSSTYMQNIGELKTDYNGYIKQIFPKGDYIAKIKHPYFSETPTSFHISGSTSLTMTDVPLKIDVIIGDSIVNICLSETINSKKEKLTDAFIEVYNSNNEFIDSYYLNEDNCADLKVKLLQNVYFKVTKTGYRELYTQEFFINNINKLDLEFELTKSVTANKLSNINYDFLGAYSDVTLKTKVSRLGYGDYYFGFKVKVPKHLVTAENKLYFYGVAGDKIDENYIDSKLIIRNVYGLGNEFIYSNYFNNFFASDKKILANLDEDKYYRGKTFSNIFNFNSAEDDLELYYVIKANVTDNTKLNDKIKLHYNFNLNNFSNFNTINLTFGEECAYNLCVEIYDQGTLLNSNLSLANYGSLTAKVEYNYDYKSKFAFYNLGLKENDSKLENLKSNDFYISIGNLSLEGFSDTKINTLNRGPIYISDLDILKTNYLEMDFNYNLATESKTKLIFSIYDDFSEKISKPYNVESVNTEGLDVTFDTEYLVPFIENKLIVYVNADDNPVNSGEVRYYYYSNGQWILGDIENISLGQVVLNIKALAIKDQIKIVVSVPNYKIREILKEVNFDFLDLKDIYLEANQNENNTELVVSEITNKSKYDINVYNGKYMPTNETLVSLYNDLLDISTMESFFGSVESLIKSDGENGKFELKVAFDKDYFMSLKLDHVLIPLIFSFYYLPKNSNAELYGDNLDIKYNKTVDFYLDIKLEGSLEKNCLTLDLENSNGESFFSDIEKNTLTYLEETSKEIYAVVQNHCDLNGYAFELKNLDLIISNNSIPLTANVFYSESPITSVTGLDLVIPLIKARKTNYSEDYRYKIDLSINDFDAIKNSVLTNKNVSFELDADYILNGLEVSNNNNLRKDLSLEFKTFEDCVYFGLPPDLLDEQLNSANPDYCVAGTNCEILRLPYYLDGERSELRNIIIYQDETSASELKKLVFDGVYEINYIPLILKNNCGLELTYDLESNLDITDLSIKKTILPNETKNFRVFRPTSTSGGKLIYLNISNVEKNYFGKSIKKLKINVESSLGNKYFVKNPFYLEDDYNVYFNQPVYVNEYYPEYLNEIINDAFVLKDNGYYGLDTYATDSRFFLHAFPIKPFDFWSSYSNFGEFYDTYNVLNNFFANSCYDENGMYNSEYCQFKNSWAYIAEFKKQLEDNTCNDYGWCYADDVVGFRYFIYLIQNSAKLEYIFNKYVTYDKSYIQQLFADLELTGEFAENKNYFDTRFGDKLTIYPKILLNYISEDNPYFINFGLSYYEGDSTRSKNIHAMTYCPSNTEPIRIYLDSKFKCVENDTDFDDRYFNKKIFEDGTLGFSYDLHVNLCDGAGSQPDGYGIAKILTVCRLKNFENYDLNRPKSDSYKTIEFIPEELTPKFIGAKESNCLGNGVTGYSVVPKMFYDLNVNCQSAYCNNYQLANYIANLIDNDYNKNVIKNLNLLYDNYSQDAYNKYVDTEFLTNKEYSVQFKTLNNLNLNLLPTGRYTAYLNVSDKNIIVDLVYQTYTLPDHLFYYMPYTGNSIPGSNLGTSLNGVLNTSIGNPYPLINAEKTPLFNYTLNTNLKSISNDLPVVLQGFVNFSENQGTGEITFEPNTYKIYRLTYDSCQDQICNLNITNTSYAHIWVKYNGNIYDGSLYFNIEKTDNTLKLSPKYDVLPFGMNNVYMITVIKGNAISNLENIFANIKEENICYTLNGNTYTYYWNIPKLLEYA